MRSCTQMGGLCQKVALLFSNQKPRNKIRPYCVLSRTPSSRSEPSSRVTFCCIRESNLRMHCAQRAILKQERDQAAMALDLAREILGERIGISSKEEFLLLDRAADDAWDQLQRA